MNLVPYIVSWAVLATVVLALAAYRYFLARGEDDFIHVDGQHVDQQVALSHKLDVIDRWGKILTIVAAVYALVVGALFMYNAWITGGSSVQ